MVLAVGPNSEWGKTMALVQTEAVDTPLQGNLTQLAAAIGKIGLIAGVLCFVALMIRYDISHASTAEPPSALPKIDPACLIQEPCVQCGIKLCSSVVTQHNSEKELSGLMRRQRISSYI